MLPQQTRRREPLALSKLDSTYWIRDLCKGQQVRGLSLVVVVSVGEDGRVSDGISGSATFLHRAMLHRWRTTSPAVALRHLDSLTDVAWRAGRDGPGFSWIRTFGRMLFMPATTMSSFTPQDHRRFTFAGCAPVSLVDGAPSSPADKALLVPLLLLCSL